MQSPETPPLEPASEELLAAARPFPGWDVVDPELERRAREELAAGIEREPVAETADAEVSTGAGSVPVRIYRPKGRDGSAILHAHGGGWVFGSTGTSEPFCRSLANATGRTVVSVEYRLAPEHPYPAPLDDLEAAFDALAGGRVEPGADPARIAVLGESAGANLAAALCLRRRDRGRSQPEAQVLVYPCFDPDFTTGSWAKLGEDYGLTHAWMDWFWRQYVPDGRADTYAAPPRAQTLTGLPRALVVTAALDPLRDEGEAYADALRRDGVEAELLRCERSVHGFTSAPASEARASALGRCAAFLASHT